MPAEWVGGLPYGGKLVWRKTPWEGAMGLKGAHRVRFAGKGC